MKRLAAVLAIAAMIVLASLVAALPTQASDPVRYTTYMPPTHTTIIVSRADAEVVAGAFSWAARYGPHQEGGAMVLVTLPNDVAARISVPVPPCKKGGEK